MACAVRSPAQPINKVLDTSCTLKSNLKSKHIFPYNVIYCNVKDLSHLKSMNNMNYQTMHTMLSHELMVLHTLYSELSVNKLKI